MTDSDDMKSRIRLAVEKHSKKEDPAKHSRKNESPERDLQKSVLKWMNTSGFSVDNIESKAHYSIAAGGYASQHQKPGIPDIVGNDSLGRAVYVELKAHGRRGSLRENQREFLVRKINTNCFAIVADSITYISDVYNLWISCENKKEYLLSLLPKERPIDNSPLF